MITYESFVPLISRTKYGFESSKIQLQTKCYVGICKPCDWVLFKATDGLCEIIKSYKI